ncbi:MAG: protease modulator HflC [Dehalococcoidia bacterium]|nr:protease modulator HflC [Dehalococcoidia bacterium]
MRFIALILILLAVIAAIIGPQLFFVVDEKELAIVTRFGQVQKSINSPGLYVKTPFIDSTTYFDKRLLIFDAPPDSLLTKDKKRLIIDVYARGRIVDPKLFRETVRTEAGGKARAVDILSSELRREIASDNQSEIITTKREDIMNRIRDNVKPKLREFGLDIIDVRIKRADFPPEIAESVYARMQAERKRISDKERAEGAEIDAQVRATVDRDATIIRANAQRTADITRGTGDAQAVQIFANAISADPEFYSFQRSLEAYRKILESNSTVVLPPNSDLFEFLQSPSGLNGNFEDE